MRKAPVKLSLLLDVSAEFLPLYNPANRKKFANIRLS